MLIFLRFAMKAVNLLQIPQCGHIISVNLDCTHQYLSGRRILLSLHIKQPQQLIGRIYVGLIFTTRFSSNDRQIRIILLHIAQRQIILLDHLIGSL